MLIKSFTIHNFLNYEYYTIKLDKISSINDINILKSLYVFKYLVTLSEDHPELASLVTNEKKPNDNEETIFKVEVDYKGDEYTYQINVFKNEIVFEELTWNKKTVYQRIKNEVILNNEPLVWNCHNSKYKPFLNTCATTDNQLAANFFFFLKENIEGIIPWINSALTDLTKKLFNEEEDVLVETIKNIGFYSNNNIIDLYYPMEMAELSSITNINFDNIDSLKTRKFLKLNIFINWLRIVEGGVLLIDDLDMIEFLDYLKKYVTYLKNIQIIIKTKEV